MKKSLGKNRKQPENATVFDNGILVSERGRKSRKVLTGESTGVNPAEFFRKKGRM